MGSRASTLEAWGESIGPQKLPHDEEQCLHSATHPFTSQALLFCLGEQQLLNPAWDMAEELFTACACGDLCDMYRALEGSDRIDEAFWIACENGHEELAFQLFMRRSPRGELHLMRSAMFFGARHSQILNLLCRLTTPAQRSALIHPRPVEIDDEAMRNVRSQVAAFDAKERRHS